MQIVLIISILIIIVIIFLSAFTTSKAYQYKHTVDPRPDKDTFKDGKSNPTDLDQNDVQIVKTEGVHSRQTENQTKIEELG